MAICTSSAKFGLFEHPSYSVHLQLTVTESHLTPLQKKNLTEKKRDLQVKGISKHMEASVLEEFKQVGYETGRGEEWRE